MRRALIGHTGFVGSTLARSGEFEGFNSQNFRDLSGQSFDEVICAGVSAVKYIANRDPEADAAGIKALTDVLETASIGRFVLISTIDVYPDPSRPLDEGYDPTGDPNHAYGLHRLALEAWARERFADLAIVRLPALFGPGLKKNMIFDLMTGNQVDKVNPAARFQWYPVGHLAADLDIIAECRLDLVNLFTEPFPMSAIVDRFFPEAAVGAAALPAPSYDLRTRHGALFSGDERYRMMADEVLDELAAYLDGERGR